METNEISLKNTKSEILDALNAALEREKAAKKVKLDPVAEEKKKNDNRTVTSTREAVNQKIFSDELISKFNDLEAAIKIEEDRLSELYGIEKELQNLTLVINAGKDALAKIEDDKKNQTDELKNSIKTLQESYSQKNEELKSDYDSRVKALKIEREREAEEYAYQLKRTRTHENNQWEDTKAAREAALAEKEQNVTQMVEDVRNKADYLAELEKKTTDIPALLEKEKADTIKSVTAELNRDYNHKTAIMEKDYSNTISQLEYKIESLTQELGKANSLVDILQEKLDKAYSQMRDLAAKTVETNGVVRFIGNSSADK
ncbi:MAG: hypothetical protein LBI03_02265 [Clostridiales bacterium]|nr:hypothetical protein [Clostridiales bacterium]